MNCITTGDGQSIAYDLQGPGDAPVVVLSHSLGTDSRLWDMQAIELAARFRVLRYDARGHGKSSAPAGEYTLERMSHDVLDIMDWFGLDQVAFCGISLGGMVGQWLLHHFPHKLSALALCNTSSYIGPPETWNQRSEIVRTRGTSAIADAVMARWFTDAFLKASPGAVQIARQMLLSTPSEGYMGSCAAIRDMDMRKFRKEGGVRTLIVAGEHDLATPPEDSRALLSRISGAQLVMLPGAHLCNLEVADAFTSAVSHFLADGVVNTRGSTLHAF